MARVANILRDAYADELETVTNYLTLSIALDGIRAEEVKEVLAQDVTEELGHARAIAQRIKELGGVPPGSMDLEPRQRSLQPPRDTTDIGAVVRGVLDAEEDAVKTYRDLIEAAREENDPVTEDLAITILADEEKHRTLFRGFQKGLEAGAATAEAPAQGTRRPI